MLVNVPKLESNLVMLTVSSQFVMDIRIASW
jgi:hypothetical protein